MQSVRAANETQCSNATGTEMKHLSIAEYSRQFLEAKTPWARFSLFVRSLSLRHMIWKTQRQLDKSYRIKLRARQRRAHNPGAPHE